MNDFTKEELQELRASRCYHLDDSFPSEDALFMKIQSMIDNYCEMKLPTMASYCCSKCNEEWHKCECKK